MMLLALPMFAQSPKPPAAPAHTSVQPKTADLTELQKAKLENITLKFSLIEQQKADQDVAEKQLREDYQKEVQSIVAEHPGFQWDPNASKLVPAAPKK